MVEDQRQTYIQDDLDDLLKEVAGADLPGYAGAQAAEEMVGLLNAQKKRRKKKNKKKQMMEAAAADAENGAAQMPDGAQAT